MKKTILFSILGILLIGLAVGATIVNKTLSVEPSLLTFQEKSPYQFSYTEKEMSDGTVYACVYNSKTQIQKYLIGCDSVNSKDVDTFEQQLISKYLEIMKAQEEKASVTITKETQGEIGLK